MSEFQSPHRRGGSRDPVTGLESLTGDPGFNPLIGGADRATAPAIRVVFGGGQGFQSPHRRGGSRDQRQRHSPRQPVSCFNPLIGGADRATNQDGETGNLHRNTLFQSPHRRGGSRDLIAAYTDSADVVAFQSPHRRGGSRDTLCIFEKTRW